MICFTLFSIMLQNLSGSFFETQNSDAFFFVSFAFGWTLH